MQGESNAENRKYWKITDKIKKPRQGISGDSKAGQNFKKAAGKKFKALRPISNKGGGGFIERRADL